MIVLSAEFASESSLFFFVRNLKNILESHEIQNNKIGLGFLLNAVFAVVSVADALEVQAGNGKVLSRRTVVSN